MERKRNQGACQETVAIMDTRNDFVLSCGSEEGESS